ncbi:MAG: hypothetical protein HQK66_04115 [Desulfamplus sp.]|nr:hypothetical protein [Desulfamplus sp.]
MTKQAKIYQKDMLEEIKSIPQEYLPNLLQIIRIFRETALLSSLSQNTIDKKQNPYPLRGIPFTYIDPTDPVALVDWEALK